MPAGQDYARRLREETRRAIAQQLDAVKEEFRTLQTNFSASTDQITRRLESILDIESPATEAVLFDAASEAAQKEVRRRDEDMSFLAHFAYDLRHKDTQEEILNALLDGALRYAPRLVLFVTRGDRFQGWASRGFTKDEAQKLRELAVPFSESPLMRGALDAGALTTATDISKESALLRSLPEGVQGPWHAFPMKAIQRPAAVLLAMTSAERRCDLAPLCILMDLTGLCIETIALKILLEIRGAKPPAAAPELRRAAPAPEAAPAAEEGVVESAAETSPAETGAPVQNASATEFVIEAPPPPPPEPFAEAQPEKEAELEVSPPLPAAAEVSEASQEAAVQAPEGSDQAVAAEEPAPETAEEIQVPEAEEAEPKRAAALREVQPLTEEERYHSDAKRFARLLASEIKLYNEQRVQEGRANKDLYARLKRDIDRSRDMYERRVSPVVSQQVDYFHDEIVRILADNDPSTLGNDYPGPRVES